MKSQKAAVLIHLRTYKSITSMTAIAQYGCTRLSDVIYKLKKDGYKIETRSRNTKNRYGHCARIAEYHLIGEEDE